MALTDSQIKRLEELRAMRDALAEGETLSEKEQTKLEELEAKEAEAADENQDENSDGDTEGEDSEAREARGGFEAGPSDDRPGLVRDQETGEALYDPTRPGENAR